MISNQITERVFYVGVNDRTTSLFESLWPLPYGVSYNAYIVKSQYTALIDSVELHTLPDLLMNLQELGIDNVDYLVVNHVEPDHSGAIPELVKRFPLMKIVGNALTVKLLKLLYELRDDALFHVVKDGDSLDLGSGNILTFHTIPMVHWPETMVTWFEREKVAFTGDAFGTFGALSGRIVDCDDSAYEIFKNEMHRYYACIVAKYSAQVQKALAKVAPLDIQYICSTHGPIWHDKAAEVVDMYDAMSGNVTRPGVVVVYGSMYGHTAQMAELVADRLAERGINEVRLYNASTTHLSFILSDIWKYKGLIIGSPTYNADVFPPIKALLSALKMRRPAGRVAGVFGCFTWASAACKAIKNELEQLNMLMPGKPVDMNLALTDEVVSALRELADSVADKILEAK